MWSISWLYVLEAVVIVTGNVITIVIFTTTPRLRSRQYALIVSLAVADLLIGLVSIPVHITFAETSMKQYPLFLLVYFMQDMFFGTASLFGLVALAIERLHASFSPFKHSSMSTMPYVIGIAIVWVLALGIGLATYVILIDLVTYVIFKVVIVTTALLIISAAYLLIYLDVSCYAKQQNLRNNRNNKKLTVTLAIVTTISLVAWVPYQYIIVYAAVATDFTKAYWVTHSVCKVLQFANSLANFFVYAFRMREFKSELVRRFICSGTQVSPGGESFELGSSFRQSMNTRMKASVVCDENK